MNSTRTSKSRDATSLHPVTKSCPFDLSTAPQSYAHLLLSLPNTKQTPRVSIFHYSQPLQHFTLRRIQIQKHKVAGDFCTYRRSCSGFRWIELGFRRIDGERERERERKRKRFLKVVFFCFLRYLFFFVSVHRERERERERVRRKKKILKMSDCDRIWKKVGHSYMALIRRV